MNHILPELPYPYDALEPYIDKQTMEIHHTKHHQTYIDKLNTAIKEQEVLHELSPEQLVRNLPEIPDSIRTAVQNHGGGHANHSFFWQILKKEVSIKGPAVDAIENQCGSLDRFKEGFSNAAALLFGSGWAWLVANGDQLEIVTTQNQDSPLTQKKIPILGLDVWEHAYYLTYQNRRPEYIAAFFQVINWAKVNENYESAMA